MSTIQGSAPEEVKAYIGKLFTVNGRGWGFADSIGKRIKLVDVSVDEFNDVDKEKARRVATTICEVEVDIGALALAIQRPRVS